MNKGIIVIPLLALGMALPATDEVASYFAGSTIHVIYDADEGKFSDGLNMKSFMVRKGITWDKLNAREKPSENPKPNDDQMIFDDWYHNGEPIGDPSHFIVDKDIHVTANYIAGESKHDFQVDSWPVLARVIDEAQRDSKSPEEALIKLHENYKVDTLIGATRKIEFDDRMYTVRVIGECQDYQTFDDTKTAKTEQYQDPALLTFEFVEAVEYDVPFDYEETSNNYKNSNLANVLNGEFFELFDKSASKYMKTVYKCTNVGDGDSTIHSTLLEASPNKVFPISLYELNADAYNAKAKIKQPDYKFPNDIEKEAGRDEPYAYYKNADVELSKKDLDGEERAYWTRSPEVESSYFVWHINENGNIGEPDYGQGKYNEQVPMDIGKSISMCPCFCY